MSQLSDNLLLLAIISSQVILWRNTSALTPSRKKVSPKGLLLPEFMLLNLDVPGKWYLDRKILFFFPKQQKFTISQPLYMRSLSSVQSFSRVRLLVTPWSAALQASLSITNSRSSLRLMSIELVMPSNHLILCCPLLLPSSTFPSIRVFSNESVLRIWWPKDWSFSFSISAFNEYSGDWFPLGLTGFISLQSKGVSRVFSNTTVQKHQFFGNQVSLWSNSHIHTWLLEKP